MALVKNRHVDQWNRIKSLEVNSQIYGQSIYNKRDKNIQWGKDSLFNKCCWENWRATCKRIKLDPYLTPYKKIKSKWIKDLNVRPKTLKPLEGIIGSRLLDISLGDDCLKSKGNKSKNKQWDYIKLKSICTAKEIINKMKKQPTKWEKIFANHISNKWLISKIYKEHT